MNIAKIIREGREKLDLNQSQLAELVGVSPQAVQQWESGVTQPRGKRLNKIAEVLKLPPALMHFGMPMPQPGQFAETMPAPSETGKAASGKSSQAATEAPVSGREALIREVARAMRHMSDEDASRLLTISKALAAAEPGEKTEEAVIDLKPLPKPDLAPHPPPAFPARRMPSRVKARGKTAI
ncbi:XRE family transcriptional regulator [Nitrosospira lacus]|uniref:Transcriptional regulator n=1 Tax=Nitrosospira lacus TaxID=1288494 RepID=A0A1W6SPJ9_9PROT|nr:helix-turn-helix transcriptional regulator [Nitrosospira lacus]ARO87725.1 XRE family transcriptional regulator [Nitrosospira lacus]